MKVLAIDYSSSQRSVAVAVGDNFGHPSILAEAVETGGRAANTFRMVDSALSQAGLEREQIDCLAIGIGPGSYTGIRSAISTAQGWQLAAGVRLLGISCADCIANAALDRGLMEKFAIVIDAQRGEYYLAEFTVSDSSPPRLSVASSLRIVSLDELRSLADRGVLVVGPDLPSGAFQHIPIFPQASVLARLALQRTDFVKGDQLTPIYLRETAFKTVSQ